MTAALLLLALAGPQPTPEPATVSAVVAYVDDSGQAVAGVSTCTNLAGNRKRIRLETEMPPWHLGGAPGVHCERMDEQLLEHVCSGYWLQTTYLDVLTSAEGVRCHYKPPTPSPTPTPNPGQRGTPAPRPTPCPLVLEIICTGSCR